ncbi:TPR repeat-containing protein [Acidisarcina polymorpha]|uniref:TPR repeat-containing protein n=1 Tax=Acidisarcina polymorpha TaxID=2211140 RepID=A0A2Z5FRW5_9BACT|nr:TPR repeat-containing protein [Acidisarcina polymorpha]
MYTPAQQPAASAEALAADPSPRGHLILVLPFENHSTQPNVDWMSESMPEVMNRRLDSAGFLAISREDRLYALDHLGLPPNFRPSRASTIRLAQNLDADSVIIGSYSSDGKRITINARILDITSLKLNPPVEEQVDLPRLLDGINSLAWRLVRQIDPAYSVAEQTFVAADAKLPLSAFENYIRGLVEDAPAERIKHLQEAVRLDPTYAQAWLALGKLYFINQQFELAAAALDKVPRTDPGALHAAFDRGLASFYTGNYPRAEEAFGFVATQLPLSEVINNQGVAASRRNQDAAPLFQRAIDSDPKDPDYHFNLALALRRRNDIPGAMREVGECLKLRPQDSEAQALLVTLQGAASGGAAKTNASLATGAADSNSAGPLERIKRNYNESAFRQAAYEIDQMQAMKLETLPPAARAAAFASTGVRYLNNGLLLEAERQFQDALQADSTNEAAHAGLAQIRERSGDSDGARLQAQQSLQLKPNVDAHLVLARLDLQANQLSSAAGEVSQALKLEPRNAAALGLRQALQSRGQQVP